jgi:hypothetical protein
MAVLSCGKDKSSNPLRPEDQGIAVTLQYQNYYNYQGYRPYCIRLTLDGNPIDVCDLGARSSSFWTRSYQWRLLIVDTRQQPETYIPVQQGSVTVDHNVTCKVSGNTVTWQ